MDSTTLLDLEHQYSPSRWSKRFPTGDEVISDHVQKSQIRTKIVRDKIPCLLNIQYGDLERSMLDVCGQDLPSESSICVFVHGGYWQELDKNLSYHPVEPLYKNKIVTIIVDYTLAPKSKVIDMGEEVKKSLIWTCEFAQKRGSKGVFLMGHSAGGQLVAEALARFSEEEKSLTQNIFGFISLAGVFDLRPLVKTYVNEPLQLTEDTAWEVSPMRNISLLQSKFPHLKTLITYGEYDSEAFKKQSILYSQKLEESKLESRTLEIAGVDHFDLIERLNEDEYELTKEILNFKRN